MAELSITVSTETVTYTAQSTELAAAERLFAFAKFYDLALPAGANSIGDLDQAQRIAMLNSVLAFFVEHIKTGAKKQAIADARQNLTDTGDAARQSVAAAQQALEDEIVTPPGDW